MLPAHRRGVRLAAHTTPATRRSPPRSTPTSPCKGTLTPLLDFAILSCAEIDRDFNVNTVTGYDGRFVGGIGGGPNVGRAKLTIIFTTLAGFSKRRGQAYPSIRERVNTVTMPGELVDVVITEEDAVINPASRSPYVASLRGQRARRRASR